ncbi:hypothetical protein BH23GEM6_BH23GEM6_11670 [soil metagenome]
MRITSKGQLTIPQDIRERIGLLRTRRSNSKSRPTPSRSARRESARPEECRRSLG